MDILQYRARVPAGTTARDFGSLKTRSTHAAIPVKTQTVRERTNGVRFRTSSLPEQISSSKKWVRTMPVRRFSIEYRAMTLAWFLSHGTAHAGAAMAINQSMVWPLFPGMR